MLERLVLQLGSKNEECTTSFESLDTEQFSMFLHRVKFTSPRLASTMDRISLTRIRREDPYTVSSQYWFDNDDDDDDYKSLNMATPCCVSV
ncbi:jg2366 [Pararge aegeria aegeria]|uniref:Jg2366 protein n=1 Tax=Pararge aegeria aegeria TaxID=348720 RepID=A0A8S4SCY2_9NEOP|nr:jg2366 [Pararge aegeria aegeria]